jgi:hypothetical protein
MKHFITLLLFVMALTFLSPLNSAYSHVSVSIGFGYPAAFYPYFYPYGAPVYIAPSPVYVRPYSYYLYPRYYYPYSRRVFYGNYYYRYPRVRLAPVGYGYYY